MPRTTIDLDSTVLQELRRRADDEHKSLGTVASEVLARALTENNEPLAPLRWDSADLGTPRVDLEDKEAVRALLERPL